MNNRRIHIFFLISIALKGLNAILEIISGLAAFFINKEFLSKILEFLVRRELEEDPGDVIANYLLGFVNQYTAHIQIFIGIYLLIHGIIKIILIYNLFKKRISVYPIAIAVFSLFVIYQAYAFLIKPSWGLVVLTILDIFIIIFTSLEYKDLLKTNKAKL